MHCSGLSNIRGTCFHYSLRDPGVQTSWHQITFLFCILTTWHPPSHKSSAGDSPVRVQLGLWPLHAFPFRRRDVSQLGHVAVFLPCINHSTGQEDRGSTSLCWQLHNRKPSAGQIRSKSTLDYHLQVVFVMSVVTPLQKTSHNSAVSRYKLD